LYKFVDVDGVIEGWIDQKYL